MLTGKLPFSSANVTALHALILDQNYVVPAHLTPECKVRLCVVNSIW